MERPEHALTNVTLELSPNRIDFVQGILSVAYPMWKWVIARPLAKCKDLMNELEHRIRYDRTSFSLIIAHEWIEDVVYVMAVLLIVLSARISYDELIQHFHIVISSMVGTMGAYGQSAVDILRSVDWVHFSYPTTGTVKKSGIDRHFTMASNALMKLELARLGFKAMVVAAPGSIDKAWNLSEDRFMRFLVALRDRHRQVLIQPFLEGTANLY